VGIPSTATYSIRKEVGNKKVKTVNMQKLKLRHCGDGDGPPKEDEGEPGRDTKGRRIQEESETEEEDVNEKKENKTKQTPDGRQMREEEGQDRAIGHATQGKTTKNDGNHKGRDVRRRTGINIIKRNKATIIPSIITGNITNHLKSNVTITNEENQQAQESRGKPIRHQRAHATNRTSLDSSNIGAI
jgi:hypothetical protein